MRRVIRTTVILISCWIGVNASAAAENPTDFMEIHQIEIVFHEAGTTKNLDLMLSLFAPDATISSGGKTYSGADQIREYWRAAGPFQPQNQWVAYTPAFRIKYSVEGDKAHLYFECLYVDKAANKIAVHTNSNDDLVRVDGKWLIKQMTAAIVPEL
jgi:SnoaL-like domain